MRSRSVVVGASSRSWRFDAYRAAKRSLFERLAAGPEVRPPKPRTLPGGRGWPRGGIVNADDPNAAVFEAAARRHDSAVAWNNLALTRQGLGDRAGALEAARRAVERAQAVEPAWLPAARQTQHELEAEAEAEAR